MKFLTITLLVFSGFHLYGQFFEKESNYLSIGYGLESAFKSKINLSINTNDIIQSKTYGPFTAAIELGLTKYLGIQVGGEFAKRKDTYNFLVNENLEGNYYYYSIKAAGLIHYPKIKKIDPYLGLGLQYYRINYDIDDSQSSTNIGVDVTTPSILHLLLGIRFHFESNYAGFFEFSTGSTPLTLGFCAKI